MFFKTARKVTDFAGLTTPSDNLDLDQDVANEEMTEDMEEEQSTNMSPEEKKIMESIKDSTVLLKAFWKRQLFPAFGEIKGVKEAHHYCCPECGEDESFKDEPLEEVDDDGMEHYLVCEHCGEEETVESWYCGEETVLDSEHTPNNKQLKELAEFIGFRTDFPWATAEGKLETVINALELDSDESVIQYHNNLAYSFNLLMRSKRLIREEEADEDDF